MFNILVVEDDKNLRKLVTTYLQRNKYNTYEATNGEEALNVLDQSYIDLIISDIMMPKMDGYELIKSLREAKYDVPILIITAKSEIEDKKEGFLLLCAVCPDKCSSRKKESFRCSCAFFAHSYISRPKR